MQIAILGPLEVRDDAGRPVDVAGARLRALLARLALDAGKPVSTAALVDAVWGDAPPVDEANALQTLVSRLRRACGSAGMVTQTAAGYRLSVAPDDVDATRFERLVSEGSAAARGGDHDEAVRLLDEALALWRGPVSDAVPDAVVGARVRLDELHASAGIERAVAGLETGAVDVAALERLHAERPLDERLAGVLMRALAGEGRPADALSVFERVRERLADELGADPGADLQAVHVAVLRNEIAAPRTEPRRTNLKARLTSFVGREDELARVVKALETNRLVTLVGPGGAGKTRLASEAAAYIDTATDGIWLVELAAVNSGSDVTQAVLGSIGQREVHLMERGRPTVRDATARLVEGLAGKRALLILDNCEHVVDAAARLAEQLLGDCPDLRILATSREPLDIFGETLLAVPPLQQPDPGSPVEDLVQYPAVRLFVDRAAAVRPDFVVDADTVDPLIEIVRRLDGLPLAIELAAARLRTMPIADIAARLSDRFRLLTGGSRTAMPRHRTLRAVVEWSWDLLTPPERRLAELLAVFPSGVTLESAAAVRPAEVAAEDVPDLLASLIDKSLLQPVGAGRRLRMLETIREYGAERLAECGQLEAARRRHADHFAQVLAEAAPHLITADQLPWFALIRDELENIVAALRFRCDVGEADGALQIAVLLGQYAMLLGEHTEVSAWTAEALAVPGGSDDELRLNARALQALNATGSGVDTPGVEEGLADINEVAAQLVSVDVNRSPFMAILRPAVAFFSGNLELTRRLLEEALGSESAWARAAARMFRAMMAENDGNVEAMRVDTEIGLVEFQRLGERWGTSVMLQSVAQLRTLDGDLEGAVQAYDDALTMMRELASSDDEVFLFGRLANLALRQGDLERARQYAEQARPLAERGDSELESAFVAALLGEIERQVGNLDRARELQAEAMVRLRAMPTEHPIQGHIRSMVVAAGARLAWADGDVEQARTMAAQAFTVAVATKDRPNIATVAVLCAELTAGTDEAAAARQLGAAAALRGADDVTELEVRRLTTRLRAALGDDVFDRAYAAGRALAGDEAIAELDPNPS